MPFPLTKQSKYNQHVSRNYYIILLKLPYLSQSAHFTVLPDESSDYLALCRTSNCSPESW